MKQLPFLFLSLSIFAAENVRTPVLIELFTSEGCSSCPPADRLLQVLEQKQPVQGVDIIVLSEHVDYWNQLGWRDPFSSPQFSARQREYSTTLRGDGVYTPQMVVDGKSGFVGNQSNLALKEIAKQAGRQVAKVRLDKVTVANGSVSAVVSVKDIPTEAGNGPFDVVVALAQTGLASRPGSGENQGASLSHTGVVRVLNRIGRTTSEGFDGEARIRLETPWSKDSLKLVAFVQDRKTHVVWGVSTHPLSE